jgi:hypothetical protein
LTGANNVMSRTPLKTDTRALSRSLALSLPPPPSPLSLLARSLALWACVCARAGAREPQARFSGRRTEPDVRRRRHVRQQDSSRVSPRPACDAGCSMLHARVVFGRGWACVWRGAGGRGEDGGAGWYALRNEEEASTDAVCSQDCPECRASKDVSHPRGPRLQGYPAPKLQGCPPPRMLCTLHTLSRAASVHAHALFRAGDVPEYNISTCILERTRRVGRLAWACADMCVRVITRF